MLRTLIQELLLEPTQSFQQNPFKGFEAVQVAASALPRPRLDEGMGPILELELAANWVKRDPQFFLATPDRAGVCHAKGEHGRIGEKADTVSRGRDLLDKPQHRFQWRALVGDERKIVGDYFRPRPWRDFAHIPLAVQGPDLGADWNVGFTQAG